MQWDKVRKLAALELLSWDECNSIWNWKYSVVVCFTGISPLCGLFQITKQSLFYLYISPWHEWYGNAHLNICKNWAADTTGQQMYAEVWFNGRTRSHDDFIRTELTDESSYTCTYSPFSPQACEAFQQIWSYRIIINCIHQYQSFRSFLYDNCNSTIKARDATLKLSPHWTVLDPLFGIPISSENSFTWCHITLQQRPYTGGVCVCSQFK